LVLLDLVMPVMDGFGLMEILKEKGVLEHLPVVVITVDGSEEILERAYSMGRKRSSSNRLTPISSGKK